MPTAALIAVLVTLARGLGRRTVSWTRQRTAVRTVVCAAAVGVCITAYALITGRSPAEAALSGQATLAQLAAHPHAWSVARWLRWWRARGWPGASRWAACAAARSSGGAAGHGDGAGLLRPARLRRDPGLALGISAAAAAVTGLPLASAVLSVLLVGGDAHDQMPLIVTGSVVAFIVAQVARRTEPGRTGSRGGHGGRGAGRDGAVRGRRTGRTAARSRGCGRVARGASRWCGAGGRGAVPGGAGGWPAVRPWVVRAGGRGLFPPPLDHLARNAPC